jgi:hypothetical protein
MVASAIRCGDARNRARRWLTRYSFFSHAAGQSTQRFHIELMAIATMKVEQIANWQDSRIADA